VQEDKRCSCGRNLNYPKEIKLDGTVVCRCGKEHKKED